MIRVQHDGKTWLADTTYEKLHAGELVSFDGVPHRASEWLGKRMVRRWEPSTSEVPVVVASLVTLFTPLDNPSIALPIKGKLLERMKSKSRELLVMVDMPDILNHNDAAFRQELIREAFHESEWGQVGVSAYEIVGVSPPDKILIRFSFVPRTRL